ncbi:MAG: S8 family serine peptidase [Bdellovibrionaceae bacterium]|nr:S8 family serine peptidase [Pseudobdellovibrionaceae bacterium]
MDVVRKISLLVFTVSILNACGSTGSSGAKDTNSKNSGEDCPATAIKNEQLIKWKTGKISRLVFKNDSSQKKYFKKYAHLIEFSENNYRIPRPKPMSLNLLGYGGDLNWGMKEINAEPVWNKKVLGKDILIAIVDSGIDPQHNQLAEQIYVNPKEIRNGLDDDGNGLIDDIKGYNFTTQTDDLTDKTGHGTHVAGVIAADHDKGSIDGLAPQAKLLIYDVFGNGEDGTVFDVISAIHIAAKSGARVINASWGGPGCSSTLRSEIQSLADSDVLFIAAAGNESLNIDETPTYPAAFNAVTQITVGAMTYDEYTAGFSNYGNKVDVVAPGVNIVSTFPGNIYQNMSGTSMATPFVTGAAALLWSAFPQAHAADIKNALLSSTKKGAYPVKTRGSIDVSAALTVLEKQFGALP